MNSRPPLDVRLSHHVIGQFLADHSFNWNPDWNKLAPLNSRALSNSMPFGAAIQDASSFFGGLLPEGLGLEKLARELKTTTHNLYEILSHIGADLSGSITVGEPVPPLEPITLTETHLERVLVEAAGFLLGTQVAGGGSATAGVQPKISLTRLEPHGPWIIGRGSIPSTHILKPVPQENSLLIRTEHVLNTIAQALSLATFDTELVQSEEREILIIERYDRRIDSAGNIVRLHQEDAAQALGLPWGHDDKYESVNPAASLMNIARLLPTTPLFQQETAYDDRKKLLKLVTFNLVAGNTDAHAKNLSFFLPDLSEAFNPRKNHLRLADAYDVTAQLLLTLEPQTLAMKIAGKSDPKTVTALDLVEEATSWGINSAESDIRHILQEILDIIPSLPCTTRLEETLLQFMQEQAQNLLSGSSSWTRSTPPALTYNLHA